MTDAQCAAILAALERIEQRVAELAYETEPDDINTGCQHARTVDLGKDEFYCQDCLTYFSRGAHGQLSERRHEPA